MKFVIFWLAIFVASSSSLALKNAICGQRAFQDGFCIALFQKFAYMPERNECVPFYYGGCGGNANNFQTLAECEAICKE